MTERTISRPRRFAVLALLCGAALGGGGHAAAGDSADRPNVLFLAVDDLNDWVGFLGGYEGAAQTPHMDALADSGMAFTRAYVSSTVCNPSRAALWTGKRGSTTGVYGQHQRWNANRADRVVSLMQRFGDDGYFVAGAGKIYHHAEWVRRDPGFDKRRPFEYGPHPAPEDRSTAGPIRFGPVDAPASAMPDYQVASFVIDQLQAERERPFFLVAGFFRPHTPLWTPRAYFERYPLDDVKLPKVREDDLDDVPKGGRILADTEKYRAVAESGNWKKVVRAYLASVTFTDAQVGRVLKALENSPHRDDTIVVLWSDHGYHHGEKQHYAKFTPWAESARVPFVMRVPGLTEPGQVSGRPMDSIDIYPTLADLCGIDMDGYQPDGISMRPLLADPDAPWKPAITLLQRKNAAVRDERWTYIRYKDRSEELYDRRNDPGEYHNVAADPALTGVKERLRRQLPENFALDAPQREGHDGYVPPSLREGFEDTPY